MLLKKVNFTVWLGGDLTPPYKRISQMMYVGNVKKARGSSKKTAVWSGEVQIGNRILQVFNYSKQEPDEFSALFQVDEGNYDAYRLQVMLDELEQYKKYRMNPPETFFESLVELTLKVEDHNERSKIAAQILVESE